MDPQSLYNPYVEALGLGTKLVGTGLQAYGAYDQSRRADQQYAMAVAAWQAEKDRQARLDEQERNQQLLSNVMAGGNYAQNMQNKTASDYDRYARGIGL
jgi:hypothetical protein